MFDIFNNFAKNVLKPRTLPLVCIYILFAITLIYKVFTIQVVKQEDIVGTSSGLDVITRETKATRGNIYDCNGVLLAYNKLSYSVVMQDYKAFENDDEKNAMIFRLIKIIEKNNGELFPEFYIKQDKHGKLIFTVEGAAEDRFKRDAYTATSIEKLTTKERNASAKEVYDHLRKDKYMFGISDKYSLEDTLKIMKIRFALLLNTYNKANPISVATNVNENVVTAVLENSAELPGVEIVEHTYRQYNESKYFSHIIGYTGNVNENEIADDNEKYYNLTDQIGKSGIEYSFEKYLRGTKGSEEATINSKYYVTDVKTVSEPKVGDNIYLTIDSKLQKVCYSIIEKELAEVLLSKIHNSPSFGEKGRDASKIMIPIYAVYNALFYNDVININRLGSKKASKIEKAVYNKFIAEEEKVIKELKRLLTVNKIEEDKKDKTASEYLDYVYKYIKNEKLINIELVDESDDVFKAYVSEKKSLGEFLKYSIANRWIDLEKLDIGDKYLSTEEIYKILLKEIFDNIRDDIPFEKIIYKNLIFNYTITGTEISLILFDQGFLKMDETAYRDLIMGRITPYYFIRNKIKKLEITPADLALDPCSGSMVITDPSSGKVRALVTYPSYDNNKLANQINAKYYAKLQADKSFPLINRPCQQKTAPGSTFKLVTTAAGLTTHAIGEHELIHDGVVFRKIDKPATCWSRISHGNIDVRTAIEVSCNYFFYETGYRMSLDSEGKYNSGKGLATLNKYASMFGFKKGVTSGVELYEYEPSISDTDSVRSAIGQGSYAFTPTQIARYISAVANGGKLNYLTIIDKITNLSGKAVKNKVSASVNKEVPTVKLEPNVWSAIKEGLFLAVNGRRSSYSNLFKNVHTQVAGKSGTAQFSTMRADNALFTSYAPYNNPTISVTCVLPYAYTSGNALKVAADFYEYYFNDKDDETLRKEGINIPE